MKIFSNKQTKLFYYIDKTKTNRFLDEIRIIFKNLKCLLLSVVGELDCRIGNSVKFKLTPRAK